MTDLNSLALFAKVVEAASFSEAARRLKMPISTVSRRIAELEDQLGFACLNGRRATSDSLNSGPKSWSSLGAAQSSAKRSKASFRIDSLRRQGRSNSRPRRAFPTRY